MTKRIRCPNCGYINVCNENNIRDGKTDIYYNYTFHNSFMSPFMFASRKNKLITCTNPLCETDIEVSSFINNSECCTII